MSYDVGENREGRRRKTLMSVLEMLETAALEVERALQVSREDQQVVDALDSHCALLSDMP